jgi:tRNA A-37 threonylcarbamoyl transferase component Bud32
MSVDPSDIEAAGVKEGDVLAGKYRVDRVLGVGGMGVVVAAHHLHLDEHVAIKFLLPQALANAEAVARFDREARAAVKIKSEHVARVIDVGKLENGAPYMVMEYLEGRDLSAWLIDRGPLPVEQAVDFVLQACEAIAEAHAMGVVHRDLKPANLYCIRRPDGALSIKVLDFGISKATGPGGSMGMTKTQAVMGSPLYMSPEQMESSKGVDARADIWAIGIILFELITGRVPFEGEAITELVLKIVTAQPPLLTGMLPGVPPGLDPIIHRCLEKNRDRRYAGVSELANDLLPFAPPSARLSVERIANIMNAAGQPARKNFHSAPPVAATQAMTGSRQAITGAGAAGMPQPSQGAGGQIPRMTDAAWGNTGGAPAPRQGPKLALVLGGAALLMLLSGGAVLLVTRKAPPPAAASSGSGMVAPPAASALPSAVVLDPPAAPSASAADTTPSAATAPTPAPQAPTTASPARPSTPGRPATPGTTPTAAPAKPAGKPNCDPPYFMDSSGHRQYKPECL